MKKKIKIILILIVLLTCTTGCKKQKEYECTISTKNTTDIYESEISYNVTYSKKVVNKIEITEVVVSNNEEIIEEFKNTYDEKYKTKSEKYEGYTYDVQINPNSIISITTIDLENIEIKDLVEEETYLKELLNDENEIISRKLKKYYKSLDATCRKK